MTDHQLTALQLAVMRSLWERSEARVSEVHADLAPTHDLASTTVATLLRRLEARGLVEHRSEGRQFVYRATVSEEKARASMVDELSERLFGGDVLDLVSHLLSRRELEAGDLERVRALIDAQAAKDRTEVE